MHEAHYLSPIVNVLSFKHARHYFGYMMPSFTTCASPSLDAAHLALYRKYEERGIVIQLNLSTGSVVLVCDVQLSRVAIT